MLSYPPPRPSLRNDATQPGHPLAYESLLSASVASTAGLGHSMKTESNPHAGFCPFHEPQERLILTFNMARSLPLGALENECGLKQGAPESCCPSVSTLVVVIRLSPKQKHPRALVRVVAGGGYSDTAKLPYMSESVDCKRGGHDGVAPAFRELWSIVTSKLLQVPCTAATCIEGHMPP